MLTAILLSHLPKKFGGDDLPITAAKSAIEFLRGRGDKLLVSAGAAHWDLLLAAALEFSSPYQLLLPRTFSPEFIREQFEIADAAAEFTDCNLDRDALICARAEKIFPVWIRRRGHFAENLTIIAAEKIDRRFLVENYRFADTQKYQISSPHPDLQTLPTDYLWHWTRAPEYLFPRETRREFWRKKLLAREPARSAFATLKNILDEKRLCGSAKFIAGGARVVAFTEKLPAEMLPLFVWRNGRTRMNFEPYAVGLPRDLAISRGAQKVRYGEKPAWNTLEKSARWESECEWRLRGDFIFDDAVSENLIVITHRVREIPSISAVAEKVRRVVAWSAD